MHNSTKFFGVIAVVVAGLVANGGTAFTASSSVTDSVAGLGTTAVSTAVVTGVSHTFGSDGVTITKSVITFGADQTGHVVSAGFGAAAPQPCEVDKVDGLSATCIYASAVHVSANATTFRVAVS